MCRDGRLPRRATQSNFSEFENTWPGAGAWYYDGSSSSDGPNFMSRTLKVLQLLQLYDEQHPVLRAGEVARQLRMSLATAYRCIADLEAAGLVESIGAGEYALGPAIVEMDRQIRIADPLIAAASDIATGLSERTRGTVLLCRLHGLKVLCVHSVNGTAAPRITGYERGRAMVLYRGATSRAILAHAPEPVLVRLLAEDADGLRRAGWPAVLNDLQERLRSDRAQKVLTTSGEVNAQARGFAVPAVCRLPVAGQPERGARGALRRDARRQRVHLRRPAPRGPCASRAGSRPAART